MSVIAPECLPLQVPQQVQLVERRDESETESTDRVLMASGGFLWTQRRPGASGGPWGLLGAAACCWGLPGAAGCCPAAPVIRLASIASWPLDTDQGKVSFSWPLSAQSAGSSSVMPLQPEHLCRVLSFLHDYMPAVAVPTRPCRVVRRDRKAERRCGPLIPLLKCVQPACSASPDA